MTVVQFPTRPPSDRAVWRCSCGCLSHFARSDGEIECVNCGAIASDIDGEWRMMLPPAIDAPAVENGDLVVTDLGTAQNAIRRAHQRADADLLAALVIVHKDGRLTAWGTEILTPENRKWMRDRLDDAYAMLITKKA